MSLTLTKRKLLRLLSIFFTTAGVLTLIPHAGAVSPSILGYQSLCSFAPVSTVLSLYAGVTLHRYLTNTDQG